MYKALKNLIFMGRIYQAGETIRDKAPEWLEEKWLENRVVVFEKPQTSTNEETPKKPKTAQRAARGGRGNAAAREADAVTEPPTDATVEDEVPIDVEEEATK